MLLADAIRAWAREHKAETDPDDLRHLGRIWKAVDASPLAGVDLRAMTKDDARGVMALFEPEERGAVSGWLNRIRKWALAAERTASAPEAPPAITPSQPAVPAAIETVRIETDSSPAPALGPESLGHGPVQGWEPVVAIPTEGPNTRLFAIIGAVVLGLVLIWFLFLRGGDDATVDSGSAEADTELSESAAPAASEADSAQAAAATNSSDFCALAREFEANDPLDGANLFGPELFQRSIAALNEITQIAPGEIRGDFAVALSGMREIDQIAAAYDYDVTDPDFANAVSLVDTTAFDTSGDRIDAYLSQECGIVSGSPSVPVGAAPVAPEPLQDLTEAEAQAINQVFLDSFGIDAELGACLSRELGDLTGAMADPALLNAPVCGTTLANVLAGIGG